MDIYGLIEMCKIPAIPSEAYINGAEVGKDVSMFGIGTLIDESLDFLPRGTSVAGPLGMYVDLAFQAQNPYTNSGDVFGGIVGTAVAIPSGVLLSPIVSAAVQKSVSEVVSALYPLMSPTRAEDYWKKYEPNLYKPNNIQNENCNCLGQ